MKRIKKNGAKGSIPEIEEIRPRAVLVINVGGCIFYAHFENSSPAAEFRNRLNSGALTLDMGDCGFGKVGPLPFDLPRNDTKIMTKPGDIILDQSGGLSVVYSETECRATHLASIGNASNEELLHVLGEGDTTATFSLEWSE